MARGLDRLGLSLNKKSRISGERDQKRIVAGQIGCGNISMIIWQKELTREGWQDILLEGDRKSRVCKPSRTKTVAGSGGGPIDGLWKEGE